MALMQRRPRGFTLIETIVALVLLEIAMLALAATAAVAARDLSDAMIQRRAFDIARNRVGALRLVACGGSAAGSQPVHGGMVERWRVDASANSRAIMDSVSVPLTRGRVTTVVTRAWTLCAP